MSNEPVQSSRLFVVQSQSGARFGGVCFLGQGATEQQAWLDAFGPKPWTDYVKRCASKAWVRQLDEGEELPEIEY